MSYGDCAWGIFGCAGFLKPVRQPAYSCHPTRLTAIKWQLYLFQEQHTMTDRIALTSNESSTPTLFIDTRAPLDELHASAAYRILAVTQLMESIVHMDNRHADASDLTQIAHASAILLRDGCDLLDVLGRRIRGSQYLN
jgi:hypothetical protein